jgi:mono/diheme cytochrome c family protein
MKPLLAVCVWLGLAVACVADDIDYTLHVRPIFARHCFRCHGPDEQRSGLRLDTARAALKGGASGAAIVPGKSGESLLVHAITGSGDAERMPPEGKLLSAADAAIVRKWIDAGAKLPEVDVEEGAVGGKSKHWSFQPVVRYRPPDVKNRAAVRNPIDQFIVAKLESQGIAPSAEADRETLIRRLSFDLTGLPPSNSEVDEFLTDSRPDAYERLVDRLLASPHYGERWGRHWLDQARYADSNGFTIDGPRSIWMYRDWVVNALNRDMPFDQFAIEQIAGDLLENPTNEQLVATGFHRNTLINQEGGTDPEQFRVEAVVDRVNTTGSVFLGLTIGCAQCHTHKYDPITHREYYQLFAFLNNADEPTLLSPTPEQARQHEALKAELAAAEKQLREHDAAQAARQAEWENRYAGRLDSTWTVLDPIEFSAAGGAPITKMADQSLLVVGGDVPATDTYTVKADTLLAGITAVRVEILTHDTLPKRGPGLSENGNFNLSEFALAAATLKQNDAGEVTVGESKPVAIAKAYADNADNTGPIELALDGNQKTGWTVVVTPGVPNEDRMAIFVASEDIGGESGTRLTFTLSHQTDLLRGSFGRFQLSVTNASREALALEEKTRALAAIPRDKRTKAEQDQLTAEFRKTDSARTPLAAKVDELKQRERKLVGTISTTMIMRERSSPRETFVHIRGDFLRKGQLVKPAVPAVLPPLSVEVKNPTRLDLARWLVDPKNPLTPRVTVNRLWQQYFGVGLVETENDFGTQGTPPTHPELLDWLASEFIEQGWRLKAMHRLMVTSATYRQSSHTRTDLVQLDPRNKLLARQARVRFEAETIRDAALAASGLLSRKIGGPSVHPPQPPGIYRFTQQDKQWKESQGEDRYRRGMYTYFWRSSPYPFLMTFDAPGGNVTCTRRIRSNTPLQALTLANDVAFVEIAQGLALRVLTEETSSDERARLEYAFRLCLARRPTSLEIHRLSQYLASQLRSFKASPEEAKAAAPAKLPEGADVAQAAAWTAVSRVLLNLDEFITRE